MTDDNQAEPTETGFDPVDPRIVELRDEAERRFGMGDIVESAYETSMARYDDPAIGGFCFGAEWAGSYKFVTDHVGDVALFNAGCANRHLGDERWLAFAIWAKGLQGWTPQQVFDDLPSWRTADQ